MKKLVLFFFIVAVTNICSARQENFSQILRISPETDYIDEGELKGTYIEIPDCERALTINGDQAHYKMAFTNKKLYVGRDLICFATRDMSEFVNTGDDNWIYSRKRLSHDDFYPQLNPDERVGLEEIEFGPFVTQIPYWNQRYYIKSDLILFYRIFLPFDVDAGAIVRISCKKLNHSFNHKGEAIEGDLTYYTDFDKDGKSGVNYVISSNCEELSGRLGMVHSYVKVESTTPPVLTYDFYSSALENAMLIVPDGCKEIYAAHEKWGKFNNICEESNVSAVETIESAKKHIAMAVNEGILRIEGDLSAEDIVEVYGIDGSRIYRGASKEISVPRGVLIVKCGKEIRKIVN